MTVANLTPSIEYAEDGATVNFPVPFRYRDPTHLKAERQAADGSITSLVYGTDYSATVGDTDAGGTLTVNTAAAVGVTLAIWRETPPVQDTDYITTGAFKAESHEDTLDELAMVDQERGREIARAPKVPRGQSGPDMDLAGLLDGDVLQYTDGKLRRLDRSAFAGKFYAGDATGRLFPSDGTGNDAALRADLASLLSGASLIAFLAAGVGAALRDARAKMRDIVSVKDFGAVGDGVADDTAAMQDAHDTGNLVYYPAGTYKFTSQVTIAAGGIRGDGKTLTILNCTDTSANAAIKFTGPFTTLAGGLVSGIPIFQDFTLNGNNLKATGAGLQFNSATVEVSYALLSGLQITYFPIGADFINASLWKIIGCDFGGHTVAGVRINNTYDNDAGDSVITGCVFNSASTVAAHVLHLTSGGLKIVGNKMLGGGYGYKLEYTGTVDTSVLVISGNSIENFTTNAISLTKVSGGLTSFKNISIADNEIGVALATPSAFLIATDANAFLQNVTITGNTFQLPGVTNSYGIAVAGITSLIIEGNTFRGNGGTSQAIGLTSCVDAKIGPNVYSNITTPYVLTTPGANNSIALDSQSGSAVTLSTGWAAYYGVLYLSATVTVNFADPFLVTPNASDVSFSLASGDGSVGVIVVSVSKTQLQFAVIADRTPGFVATVNWKVWGVL